MIDPTEERAYCIIGAVEALRDDEAGQLRAMRAQLADYAAQVRAEERERCRLASCYYCRLGWPMLQSIAMPDERHSYPSDYKGLRAGAGPNCEAAAIRALKEKKG